MKPTNWVKCGIFILTLELKQPEDAGGWGGGALSDLRAATSKASRVWGTGILKFD